MWGWGHLATGDRRGLALGALEIAWLAAFAVAVPRLVDGTWSGLLFVAGVAFLVAWIASALDAYRRAARAGGAHAEAGPADRSALDLLWLAPVAIAASTAFWGLGGRLASPEATLAGYVTDWRTDRPGHAAAAFVHPPAPGDLAAAWERQEARLQNELVALAALPAEDGLDPHRPFDSLRFRTEPGAAGDTARVAVEIVRRETVGSTFFGLVPTTAQRLVPVRDLGTVELHLVPSPDGLGGTWRVASVDLLSERLGEAAAE